MDDALLRRNAALLIQREQEIEELRRRYARALGWLEAVEEMSALTHDDRGFDLVEQWPQIIVARLELGAASLWRVEPRGDGLSLVSYAGAAPPSALALGAFARALDAEPDGIDNGEDPTELGAGLGLCRFLWNSVHPAPGARLVAAAGYGAASFWSPPAFTSEDLGFARMAARLLEAMLAQVVSIGELTQERERLRDLNDELTRRDRELRSTRDELMESTRLAAVGELAGLTAHEVLNPITSIQGRVARMIGAQEETFAHNQRSLSVIPEVWGAALARGGIPALVGEISAPSPLGGTLAEEDVTVLGQLEAYFDDLFMEYRADLGFVLQEIRRVTQIVDGMRGLSRRRSSPAPTRLAGLISESLDGVADTFKKCGILPTFQGEGDVWVEVDRYECIQVVTNLLRNAALSIEERGAGGGAVRVRLERAGRRALLRVEDDGIGVAPEQEARLFEMRFASSASGAGAVLGLCIARRLVRGWQGDLRLAWTRPGAGAGFVIDLPLSPLTPERER